VTQERQRRQRPATDEGASYTKLVMDEVTARREALRWSAEDLAAEMARAGVPWTRETVTNLENGRRKRLAVHEVLALAYVLDVDNPVDLIVPAHPREPHMVLLPGLLVPRAAVRGWFEGKTGPLRKWLSPTPDEERQAKEYAEKLRADGMPESMVEQIMAMVIGLRHMNGGDGGS
jgi:transcriptional regulator with XRE-family HTH domain